MTQKADYPKIRATGVLVENGRLLLVHQRLRERAHWNLPGGGLEPGETLGECLVREMLEETGLEVRSCGLLYVTDRFKSMGHQVLDMSFLVQRTGGELLARSRSDGGSESIVELAMVPVGELALYGFSDRFCWIVKEGFPQRGSYQGDFREFYG